MIARLLFFVVLLCLLVPSAPATDSAGSLSTFHWKSTRFAGSERDIRVYLPAGLDPTKPACLTVFQDGAAFADPKGAWQATAVLDRVIEQKQIPLCIGLFIDPGVVPPARDGGQARDDRRFEYVSRTDDYASFVSDEIIPELEQRLHVAIAPEPNARAILGADSGGLAAFNAAWLRPDRFARAAALKVDFAADRAVAAYSSLIPLCQPRAIRVLLNGGSHDTATLQVGDALSRLGYDQRGLFASEKTGPELLADALISLWKDYPQPIAMPRAPSQVASSLLAPEHSWRLLSSGHQFTEGPAPDRDGNLYFTDIPASRIYKVDPSGKVTLFAENTNEANGLADGGDGLLYAVQKKSGNVVAYDAEAHETIVAKGIEGLNDLVIARDGGIYVTQSIKKDVWYLRPKTHAKKLVDHGINWPNGVALSPDQSQLIVADTHGPNLWSFSINPDGTLSNKQPRYTCEVGWNSDNSGADGLAVDNQGRIYAATKLGIQVFAAEGQLLAILDKPQNAWLANLKFGGDGLHTLYVACGDKVFRRVLNATGIDSAGGSSPE